MRGLDSNDEIDAAVRDGKTGLLCRLPDGVLHAVHRLRLCLSDLGAGMGERLNRFKSGP